MKRKLLTVFLTLIAALCLCFALVGCNDKSDSGNGGSTPDTGINSTDTEQGGPQTPEPEPEPEPEHTHSFTVNNVCGGCGEKWTYTTGLQYQLNNETNTYTVTGIGTASGDVTIPYGYQGKEVTSIGDWAFGGCSGLTSVTIPDSVTLIGGAAQRMSA